MKASSIVKGVSITVSELELLSWFGYQMNLAIAGEFRHWEMCGRELRKNRV